MYREGDEGDALYIVKSGSVRIISGSTVYETVKTGGIVGEMEVVEKGVPRNASVIGATTAELIRIDIVKFGVLVASKPDFSLMVMGVMARRLRVMSLRYRGNRTTQERTSSISR